MPKESIIGSGRRGFGFEQKGFQERNLALLLETLSKKEVQKSIEVLSKIDKDEWTSMATTATMLNNFVSLGGVSTLTTSIKETIRLQIDSLLSPLTNEINQAITDIITPFINDLLTPLINDLSTFLSENKTGAGIGGILGALVAMFLPGGVIWIAIGALIGSYLEENWEGAYQASVFGGGGMIQMLEDLTQYGAWLLNNPGGTIAEFLAWLGRVPDTPGRLQDRLGGPQVGF